MLLTVLTVASLPGCRRRWRRTPGSLRREERLRSDARVAALAAAIEGRTGHGPGTMFDRDPRSAVQGRPLLKVAVGFAMAVGIIVLIAMSGDRREAPAATPAPAAQSPGEALELLSMRHQRAGDALTVTGLVRNPGAAPGPITAVVFAFDREGGFVASGRAPLEFATIAAGDESPFQVTVPDVKDVGRYRVSFRTTAGVVPHVDRRADAPGISQLRIDMRTPPLLLALAAVVGRGRVDGRAVLDAFRFRSGVELVNVTATVTDDNGRFVSGLLKEDFTIFEDGKRQDVSHFSNERVPVSLGILLDASGSMTRRQDVGRARRHRPIHLRSAWRGGRAVLRRVRQRAADHAAVDARPPLDQPRGDRG